MRRGTVLARRPVEGADAARPAAGMADPLDAEFRDHRPRDAAGFLGVRVPGADEGIEPQGLYSRKRAAPDAGSPTSAVSPRASSTL